LIPSTCPSVTTKVNRSCLYARYSTFDALHLSTCTYLAAACSTDLDYWKVPSRRFYVAEKTVFEEVMKIKDRKRLSLRKHKGSPIDLTNDESVGERLELVSRTTRSGFCNHLSTGDAFDMQIANDVTNIKETMTEMKQERHESIKKMMKREVAREQMEYLDCKICREVPTPPVVVLTCCNQLLGWNRCFLSCMNNANSCPLCRTVGPSTLTLRGLDSMFAHLKEQTTTYRVRHPT